ncbi:hypothetical protein BaRGS_00022264 [Batillaria attramentaria]|uniref:Uncharacterized protein n=1 Tax=Batillaria attramentaria TaxID=370345 RepID=A0ABD0KGZ7_9CAEN
MLAQEYFYFAVISFLVVPTHGDTQHDLKQLCSLIPGFYDNKVQYETDIAKGLPIKQRHQRLQTSLVEEDVPFLAGWVNYYIEQYVNGDENSVIRQRLYSFGVDSEGRIALKIYSFKDPSQVLHAKAFDPIFQRLTQSDVIYSEGCDVFWHKADSTPLRFQSWAEKTCYVNINGNKVLIEVAQNWTKSYLTSLEKWIAENGTDILGEPSPYNMTRQNAYSVPRQGHLAKPDFGHHARNKRSKRLPTSSSTPVTSFKDSVQALIGGRSVTFEASLDGCSRLYSSGTPPQSLKVGGLVDTYEYFDDPKFGSQEFFGFSFSSKSIQKEGVVTQLTEVLAFSSGQVSVNVTVLTADLRTLISKTAQTAVFYVDDATVTSLPTYESLRIALENGDRVRYTSNYQPPHCIGVDAKAIGGTSIVDFELYKDRIESSSWKMITNYMYHGSGFVYDVVNAVYWSNSSVIFTASDVDVVTFKPYYSENIYCQFGNDSTHFYLLA